MKPSRRNQFNSKRPEGESNRSETPKATGVPAPRHAGKHGARTTPAHDEIPADRLFEATEAVLEAAVDLASRHGNHYTPPMHTMGTSEQPSSLDGFTRYEVCAATCFLRRMGYLPDTAR